MPSRDAGAGVGVPSRDAGAGVGVPSRDAGAGMPGRDAGASPAAAAATLFDFGVPALPPVTGRPDRIAAVAR